MEEHDYINDLSIVGKKFDGFLSIIGHSKLKQEVIQTKLALLPPFKYLARACKQFFLLKFYDTDITFACLFVCYTERGNFHDVILQVLAYVQPAEMDTERGIYMTQ